MTEHSQALFGQDVNATNEWATPQELFDKINKVFNFTLDVCATDENAKCDKYYTKEIDGLSQEWTGTCWMNPPYSREIAKWILKAHETALNGHTVVALIPSRTGSRWFQDYCLHRECHFIKGRLKFGDSSNSAPFDNVVVVFRPSLKEVFS